MPLFDRIKTSIVKKSRKRKKILKNVFHTTYKKTALVSYIKAVFESDKAIDQGHTNRLKTLYIAEVVSGLGYDVDIVDWQSNYSFNFSNYDLVIGLGKPLDYILSNRIKGQQPWVVWFGTGCNPIFSNKISLQRIVDFYMKKGNPLLSSSRYIFEDWPLQHEIADWIILHGDKFARSTYRNYNIDSVLAPVYIYHSFHRSDDEWLHSKSNFLWFSGGGAIHKGLDLLIEAFKDLPQYTLHICANLEQEKDFFDIYRDIIKSSENIVYHGFVKVQSDVFKEILKRCAFIIYPSASEGNSASVITSMVNGGLIPIVTKNADVDIDHYGIEISGFSREDIYDSINRSQKLTVSELKEQSERIVIHTTAYHSFEFFKEDFKKKLAGALNSLAHFKIGD